MCLLLFGLAVLFALALQGSLLCHGAGDTSTWALFVVQLLWSDSQHPPDFPEHLIRAY